jgi:hypothetical protein
MATIQMYLLQGSTTLAQAVGTEYFKPLSSELVVLGDFDLHWLTPASDSLKYICLDFT